MYLVPNVHFPSPSITRECLLPFYICDVLLFFFSSLLAVSCCTVVSDLVMYAPRAFDPPCPHVLCTLHNHPLLSLEVYLGSLHLFLFLSLTHSFLFFSDTPTSSSSNSGHPSFPLLSPIPNLKSWSSRSPCVSCSFCVFVFSLLSSCHCGCTLARPVFLILSSLSSLSTHLPLPASCSPLSQWSH